MALLINNKRNAHIADLDDCDEAPEMKSPKTLFGTFASDTLDSFINKAPDDILELIANINRRNLHAKIAEQKKNDAKKHIELAFADFCSDIKDAEYQTEGYITSIAVHNDFERATRHASNEVLFMTNKVSDYIINRYEKAGAFANYDDLYKMQADCIKQMRASVYSSADFIFMLAKEYEE
ncbi:hypothetical protein EXVG_00476 [Emiliania huxleyi virus 202]|nr:hypothetical protein EXVG_00476 [Emiliania huxleyi virus 202]AHA54385.1 hypothetical protein EhV18_00339 [Emiliania huxleyi virus 18]AHA55425.1 hypothetical protein EhV156_00330 [Emiliania huxleyi virus 156]